MNEEIKRVKKEIRKEIKEAIFERDSSFNKGIMDKDYWSHKIDQLKDAIELIESPSEEYALGISHAIRFLKINKLNKLK